MNADSIFKNLKRIRHRFFVTIIILLLFVFGVFVLECYLTESSIGSLGQSAFLLRNKKIFYYNRYSVCYYEISVICREDFFLRFHITERDAKNQKQKITTKLHNDEEVQIEFDDSENNMKTKQQRINFDAKQGIYWYVDIIIITSSDGSFCVIEKNQNLPKIQTKNVYKNFSLTNPTASKHVIWKEGIRDNTTLMIGSEYELVTAYLSDDNLTEYSTIPIVSADVFISVKPK
jgi:hypothetical protein